jgi:histidine ammonia-lyase
MVSVKIVKIDGNSLKIEDVVEVASNYVNVDITDSAKKKVSKCREVIDDIIRKGTVVYGVNTGVGGLSNVPITKDQITELQKNLIMSHATGVGEPLSEEVVRAAMLLSANALAKGFSGVRLSVIETLLAMLNKKVHPVIPEKGSVGASGDLAPLSHMALVITGKGEALYNGKRMSGKDAMKMAGIETLILKSKEGLAIINGTEIMTAVAALNIYDAERMVKTAQIAGAMCLEALKGSTKPFDERIHVLRAHKGQKMCAANIRTLTKGSEIIASHKDCPKVQDAYTLRCMAQVYGAVIDTISYAKRIVETEINSTTDNPIVFPETGEVISGGNFHGEPIAFAMDFLGIALAELGNISERTIYRLIDHNLSEMPSFLIERSGLHSGFMITQYTAAALVSENKVLSHPASTDSIPTSAGQEDHVSMGTIAARKARQILENVGYVVAIELLCAAQGIDFQKPLKAGVGVQKAYTLIRKHIPKLEKDRIMYIDVEKINSVVKNGGILETVEKGIGKLQ